MESSSLVLQKEMKCVYDHWGVSLLTFGHCHMISLASLDVFYYSDTQYCKPT